MKVLITITAFLFLLAACIFTVGIVLDNKYQHSEEIFVDVPEAIVLNTLTDFSEYDRWCSKVSQINRIDERERTVVYRIANKQLAFHEVLSVSPDHRTIQIVQKDKKPINSLAGNFRHTIKVSTLADGSTRVLWSVSYQIKPFLARVVNQFFLSKQISNLNHSILADLKNELES